MNVDPVVETVRIEQGPEWLLVDFGAGSPRASAYHFRWLRHHTSDELHPITGERLSCSSELPDDLLPLSHRILRGPRGPLLSIAWSDARTTEHELAWLQAHSYATERDVPRPPDIRPASYEVHAQGRSFESVALEAVERVRSHGLVIVRAAPGAHAEAETEPWIEAFETAGLVVTPTHFGRIEDLRPDNTTNENNDQLGYTDAPIQLHTDQPFLDEPPHYQLLQAVVPAAVGGENVFVDALAASVYYASIAAHEHALLSSLPVRFSRRQKQFSSDVVAPILQPATATAPFRVRFSYFTLAPLAFPFALTSSFYRAHDAFARLVREPRRGVTVGLAAGDFALYDNHRMLHARRPFQGPRWMRGVYFDPR